MNSVGELLLAARLARRELRAGLRGFGVFLACLALGVAAVAGVKSFAAAYAAGLAADAAALLGGDVEASLPQRPAGAEELAALGRGGQVSHVVSMRVMVRGATGGGRTLAALAAVDQAYPLYGTVALDPPLPLAEALASRDGLPGAVAAPELLSRLHATVGDVIQVADVAFAVRAVLVREPDAAGSLAALGPRLLVSLPAVADSGLLAPGSLTRHLYRVKLPPGGDAAALAKDLRAAFPQAGWRVRDASGAQPGLSRFMDRLTAILGLVGLAALLLGGIGVSQAVSGYLAERTAAIAAMKCLGAPRRLITTTYLTAVMLLAAGGILVGLAVGAAAPAVLSPLLSGLIPVRLAPGPYPGPLALAGAFGVLTALAFSLPHLAFAGRVSPLVLFRGYADPGRPRTSLAALLPAAICFAALMALAVFTTPDRKLGLGFAGSVAGAALVFWLFARLAVRLVRLAPTQRPGLWPLALRGLGRPGNQVGAVLASLGLGLTALCAMALVNANFSEAFRQDIPRAAPDFFFVDIQPGQLDDFLAATRAVPGVTRVETSPTVRGRVVRIKGVPAEDVAVEEDAQWAVRGDRGLTYAAAMPEGTRLVAGSWWPSDYNGPPLASVDAAIAKGLGLKLGDTVTLNVLGREITVTVASLRQINWLTLGINYVFVLSPGSLNGLPLTYLATAYTDKAGPGNPAEAVFKAVTDRFPNITAIGIGDALADVLAVADKVAAAVSAAAGAALGTGILVLVQTMAAGMRRKAYETVIYKVCGATRRDILTVLVLENALVGTLAGGMALVLGSILAAIFVIRYLELPFRFFAGPALAVVAVATGLTLVFGLAGIFRLLGRKAWPALRNE